MWVWGEEEGFMKRGKEGMLVITDRRLVFISKTNMTYRIHDVHASRQLKRFKENANIFRPVEGYTIQNLQEDMKLSEQNLQFPFSQILDIESEDKRWGTLLKVKINLGDRSKIYKYSIVSGWVKYPAKDPILFQRMDWSRLIEIYRQATAERQ
jgi:hypothetical protein